MIEITKENDEIKIVKSYKKIIKYSQAFMIFVILLFSFFAISYEKITIKENYILL